MSEPGPQARAGHFTSLVGRLRSTFFHGSIDSVGAGTVFAGRPYVSNDGEIRIGAGCRISSHPIQSHLIVLPNANITIGDRVSISYGAAISTMRAIQIGDDTKIGPYCVILDNDFHKVGDRDSPGVAVPVEIGRRVTIGARVTVLRGSRIGDGACIKSGSTVAGLIAEGAVVSGVPARVAKDPARNQGQSVIAAVMRVFGLAVPPGLLDGPAQIPAWTPGGAVRLLLALEGDLGVTLSENQVRGARTIADVVRLVAQAHDRQGAAR